MADMTELWARTPEVYKQLVDQPQVYGMWARCRVPEGNVPQVKALLTLAGCRSSLDVVWYWAGSGRRLLSAYPQRDGWLYLDYLPDFLERDR